MRKILGTLVLAAAAGGFAAEPSVFWRFEDGKAGEAADTVVPAGKAGVCEKGTLPVFDSDVAASNLWDGATYVPVTPGNCGSLRFACGETSGPGAPVGGEVIVSGKEELTRPERFTAEAFVKVARLTQRHALIVSKRRNGQTGASWSLSVTPSGTLGVRFDTQPGTINSGEGFNQCFGTTGALNDGQWHHVALTLDKETLQVGLYVDYQQVGKGVARGPLVYDGGDLVIGRGLDGWLDEVRLTPEVLHPEQFLRPVRFFSEMKPRVVFVPLLDQTQTRVQSALKPELKKLGTLIPKSVPELGTSMWSLGCETLDRDLANWDAYRGYLVPLGIKRIRLQGGWGRTEKAKGVYDFGWLDHVVDDAISLGLEVCLETSYGNRLYEKNAAGGPGGLLPAGEETLAAWDRWVEAMVKHYAPKGVHEWMMFNEPNLRKENTAELIVANNIRTAEIIKRVDPEAKVGAFVLSGISNASIEKMLTMIKEQGKLDLFHWAIYHGYSGNPDRLCESMGQLTKMMKAVAPKMRAWQGEAGCASEEVQYALSGIDWTEYSHAKWNARRMLCDLGYDIESSVFTITDLSYSKDFISRYGLIKTNPDNSIIKVKSAYYMVQNVVTVFNDSLTRVPDYEMTVAGAETNLMRFAFRDKKSGLDVIALWNGTEIPGNGSEIEQVQITVKGGHFKEPVWVDLITGVVYEIPLEQMAVAGETVTLADIPVYDGPAAIMDKSLITYEPAKVVAKKAATNKTAKGAKPKLAQPQNKAKAGALPVVTHLLPGTQQPAPAVLILAQKGEAADTLVKWLNDQEIHAFALRVDEPGVSEAALQDALLYIRSHSAEWQVRTGSVGVLGLGANGALAVRAVNRNADFAVVLGGVGMELLKGVAEAKRPAVFLAKKDAWQEPLAAWLGKFKGKVF